MIHWLRAHAQRPVQASRLWRSVGRSGPIDGVVGWGRGLLEVVRRVYSCVAPLSCMLLVERGLLRGVPLSLLLLLLEGAVGSSGMLLLQLLPVVCWRWRLLLLLLLLPLLWVPRRGLQLQGAPVAVRWCDDAL